MKERQRWQAEEDTVLSDYVKQYGPRDWHLVSERMGTLLDRDAKSCVERWKNYLKPGIKKGPLSDEEQQLVISLQAKYGNKWKKIAAEVPGRTAKRLGKWWEVYKDKQQKEKEKDRPRFAGAGSNEGTTNYSEMLASLADKFGQRPLGSAVLPTPPFPMPPLVDSPAIAPLTMIGTAITGRPSGPSAIGVLTSQPPSFDAHSSLPLATLAVPVSVMTTAIGSWLSSAITASQCTAMATATLDLDVKAVPMQVTALRASEAYPATNITAKVLAEITQGPMLGPAEDERVSVTIETSSPFTSGVSSSLPAWMSNVPSSAAQTPVSDSNGQTTGSIAPPAVIVAGASTTVAREGSVSPDKPQLAMSLSISSSTSEALVPGVSSSDPALVLAQRAWLHSRKEGRSRDMVVDANVSTEPAWCLINPQITGQMVTGPNLVLSRPMPPPDMSSNGSNWIRLLEFCKDLEESRQFWYSQRKEASWRLKRLEAKLEAEKMQRWKQKMEEVEASIVSLRAEECRFLEGLEADYKEKISSLHREEEQKDAKLVEMWNAKHMQLMHFLEQVQRHSLPPLDPQSHSGVMMDQDLHTSF